MKYLRSLEEAGEAISDIGKRESLGYSYEDGIPDVHFTAHGIQCELELKAPNGKPSAIQLKWQLIYKRKGTPYLRSSNYEEVVEFINKQLNKD